MAPTQNQPLLFRYRCSLAIFLFGLIVSGLTAFPLLHELETLAGMLGVGDAEGPGGHSGLAFWILTVRNGLREMHARFPWIAYGTDWLAFGHLAIALFFIGPWISPIQNKWVLYVGLALCAGVIPLALICGPLRGIPLYWRLIDCSFGVLGSLPLIYCLQLTRQMNLSASRKSQEELEL